MSDAVEAILDAVWSAAVRGPVTQEQAQDAAGGDPDSLERAAAAAEAAANELRDRTREPGCSRRDASRARLDAETYEHIAEVCRRAASALPADEPADPPPAADVSRQAPEPAPAVSAPPLMLAPPLLVVSLLVVDDDATWKRTIRFTTLPRTGDRLDVGDVALTTDLAVWSLDSNQVAVPTVICRLINRKDSSRLESQGWVRASASGLRRVRRAST